MQFSDKQVCLLSMAESGDGVLLHVPPDTQAKGGVGGPELAYSAKKVAQGSGITCTCTCSFPSVPMATLQPLLVLIVRLTKPSGLSPCNS